MALTDEVQARYSSQVLINASNPQNSGQTALDSTRLSYASTDVQAEFSKMGMTFTLTDAKHVATAVPGVYARLLVLTGQGGMSEWRAFIKDLIHLSKTDARDRIKPSTDSLLNPTTDTLGAKPASDKKDFYGFVPKAPSGSPTSGFPQDSNP